MVARSDLIDVAEREVVLADFVPFSSHLDDHVIRTREGDYLRVWRIAGIAFEAADPGDILVRHEGFNQLVRSLPGGHVGLWLHRIRRRVTDHFATPYGNPFCQALATRYYASFAGYARATGDGRTGGARHLEVGEAGGSRPSLSRTQAGQGGPHAARTRS